MKVGEEQIIWKILKVTTEMSFGRYKLGAYSPPQIAMETAGWAFPEVRQSCSMKRETVLELAHSIVLLHTCGLPPPFYTALLKLLPTVVFPHVADFLVHCSP